MKINGIERELPVPRVLRNYVFTPFDKELTAVMVGGMEKTVDVKSVLNTAWAGINKRALSKICNDYFATLPQKKSLSTILSDGDIVLHCLQPKEGYTLASLPYANTAGRDIGIDPQLLFDVDPNALVCTLIHELAHVGGASTNTSAPFEQAHAAEKALTCCGCKKQYNKDIVGSIRPASFGTQARYA